MRIGTNAEISFPDLSSGSHTPDLSGLAPNCVLAGSNPRPVAVAAGETTRVTLEVICAALSLRTASRTP